MAATVGQGYLQIVCGKGHSYQQSERSAKKGSGCPYCTRKKAWPGETDVFTELPSLRQIWDFKKNEDLDPSQLLKGSDKVAWWVCNQGHEFQKSIFEMSKSGCGFCSNKNLLQGFNDLATVRPDLAAEFDLAENGGLTPSDLMFGTAKKVWWKCHLGHRFEAKVSQRNFANTGCPVCKGKKTQAGFNDLFSKYPEIANSWDEQLNHGLSPKNISPTSSKKVWWKCPRGHSWLMRVGDRVTHSQGCAVCANRQILQGVNDLQSLYPEVAKTLAPILNPDDFATKVGAFSTAKAWWVCPLGHQYKAAVVQRQKVGCAYCAGQKVLRGFNDLESQNPDGASHFLQGRNGISPSEVHVNSRAQYWWECDLGHHFRAHPDSVRKGNWCPFCGNKRVLRGFNDLASVAPELAAEWHPTLNGETTPFEVLNGSHAKYWWLCAVGHSFAQTGKKRRAGQGCPGCAKSGFNPTLPALLYVLSRADLEAIKVGITNAESDNRLRLFRESGWEVRHSFRFRKGTEAEAVEAAFFNLVRNEHRIPVFLGPTEMKRTGGWTETMSLDLAPETFVLSTLLGLFEELGYQPAPLGLRYP
jgi:hypothetical protein